ncbi:hypothetical protein P7C73_g5047, partial [Tremellales sp. Uapishka_1]
MKERASGRPQRKREARDSDSEEDADEQDKVASKREKLHELEQRVAQFEKALKEQENATSAIPAPRPAEPLPFYQDDPQAFSNNFRTVDPPTTWNEYVDPSTLLNAPIETEDSPSFSGIFDLMWPDWPRDLPTPEVVQYAIGIFFEKVPTVPKMIHKATFLQDLQFPPSHSRFPAIPLLHAILAITSSYIPSSLLSSPSYFPIGTPSSVTVHPQRDFQDSAIYEREVLVGSLHNNMGGETPLARFQSWHRRKSISGMTAYFDRGEHLLQCLQDLPEGALEKLSHMLLMPSMTAIEQAERERTFWMVYMLDRFVAMSTTWPTALAEEDVSVELPVPQDVYLAGTGNLVGHQTMTSPDFYSSHPPESIDSFGLLIKSLRLFTAVNAFFRKYTRGVHSVSKYVNDPAVRLLLSQLSTFRLSFPASLRRPVESLHQTQKLDTDALAAVLVIHGATLSLGEPLVTKDHWHDEVPRIALSAIRAGLSIVYNITSTSYDSTPTSTPHLAKGLIRFMEAALESGDLVSVSVFRSEVDVFRMATIQFGEKFPVGVKMTQMLDQMLAEFDLEGKVANMTNCTREQIIRWQASSKGRYGTPPSSSAFTSSANQTPSSTFSVTNPHLYQTQSSQSSNPQKLFEGDPTSLDGFDISNFAFDVNAVAEFFNGNDAMFTAPEGFTWN